MIILKSDIDSVFLHAWLKLHKFTSDQLELKPKHTNRFEQYVIGNHTLNFFIEKDYDRFKASGQSVEDYLNIDIILFKENSQGHFYTSKTKTLDRQIILLFTKKNSNKFFLDHVPMSTLKSTRPIEMSLKSILSIYGIRETIDILPLSELNLFKFENNNQVCIDLYKRNGNMCQKHYDFPDNREPNWDPNHRIKIAIDNLEIPYLPKYFWVPCESLVSKELLCSKLPGICGYSTNLLPNLKRHEDTCTDETKIQGKQV